jgi:hypothetical protein
VKCNNKLNPLRGLSHSVKSKHLEQMYMSYVLPHLVRFCFNLPVTNIVPNLIVYSYHYHAALILWDFRPLPDPLLPRTARCPSSAHYHVEVKQWMTRPKGQATIMNIHYEQQKSDNYC